VDQGEEETWDTVGGATKRSQSPAPTTTVSAPEAAQQATVTDEPRPSVEERRPEPYMTTRTAAPVVARVEEEAPVEAGLVDIASILGALTVTVVRSSL
jgi:hypothetical protein